MEPHSLSAMAEFRDLKAIEPWGPAPTLLHIVVDFLEREPHADIRNFQCPVPLFEFGPGTSSSVVEKP
jgi:hypothetical protein